MIGIEYGSPQKWPTPTTSMRTIVDMEQARYAGGKNRYRPTYQEMKESTRGGGALNPVWTEWLMGWPLRWTSMEPMLPETWAAWQAVFGMSATDAGALAMDKSQPPLHSPGKFYTPSLKLDA